MSRTDQLLRRFQPYRDLPTEDRERHLASYLAFLRARDGEFDVSAQTLSQRESYFNDLETKPVRWAGDLDLEGFFSYLRSTATPELDARTALLLTAARANLGEAYGVEIELRSIARRPEQAAANPLYLYMMLEERYHTRILDEICRTVGIEPERHLPSRFLRGIIHAMMYFPERLRWIFVHVSEVLGAEVFNILRDQTRLFSQEPEVEARLRELFTEIWSDEVLHVAYLRAKLNRYSLRLAELMMPTVARSMFAFVPHSDKVGITVEAILDRVRQGTEIPPGVDWIPSDSPAA